MDRGLNRMVKRLVSTMDLPADAILDLPRVTMIGNAEILIENHKGLEKYTSAEIRVRVKDGYIVVHGRRLAVRFIDRDDLKLEGVITGMEVEA